MSSSFILTIGRRVNYFSNSFIFFFSLAVMSRYGAGSAASMRSGLFYFFFNDKFYCNSERKDISHLYSDPFLPLTCFIHSIEDGVRRQQS